MSTVADCMTKTPLTIDHDLSMADARERMASNNIRHLPVFQDGHLVGVVSDRDLAIVSGFDTVDMNKTSVAVAMSEKPYTVEPGESLRNVVATMAERKIGTAVVMDDGKLAGVFTTIDAMRKLAEML